MTAKDLELDFGDVLQMQFLPEDKQNRHYVRVIGYWPNQSIIVTTPHVNGKVILVRESQRVAVRSMSGVNIIAFTGTVLRSCARPYPYLHISYPKELQTMALRKAQRVTFSGIAEVREAVDFLRYYAMGAEKDFAASDAIRDELAAKGVEVMDGDPLGWEWKLAE